MNCEIGIDMYTLICIKWITNKNLLYKKINKIKFKNSKKPTKLYSGWLPITLRVKTTLITVANSPSPLQLIPRTQLFWPSCLLFECFKHNPYLGLYACYALSLGFLFLNLPKVSLSFFCLNVVVIYHCVTNHPKV